MGRKLILVLVAWMILLCGPYLFGQTRTRPQAEVKYVSKEAVYIDAGRKDGLSIGDTLEIDRNNQLLAFVVVQHLSSTSSSGRVIRSTMKIEVGDVVRMPGAAATPQHNPSTSGQPRSGGQRRTKKPAGRSRSNAAHVRGYFSIQNYWQFDNSKAGLSNSQPGFSGGLQVENLGGPGLSLRFKQRSRLYHRSTVPGRTAAAEEWLHRLYELSLVYEAQESPWEFGLGRVYSPHIRGMGYLDGMHVARKITDNLNLGMAAGREPNDQTLSSTPVRSKYGAFMTIGAGAFDRQRWEATVAAVASYEKGVVNREFIYVQNNLWLAKRLSLYQSVEIDLNRHWRRTAAGEAASFSNFYLSANFFPGAAVSVYFSYDARKNIRTLSTIDTPDSLFDRTTHEGVNGGLTIRLPAYMRLGTNFSVRFSGNGLQDIVSTTVSYSIRHFPRRGHAISSRFSVLSTPFTRAYRPLLSYRLPVHRYFTLGANTGGYIYKSAAAVIKTYFIELQGYAMLHRAFITLNLRQYLEKYVSSKQVSLEIGLTF